MSETIIIPIVLGLTQVVKNAGLSSRWSPIVSIVLGVGITITGGLNINNVVMGIVYGLSASGLWSGTKAVVDK